jgi:hypothetical protein
MCIALAFMLLVARLELPRVGSDARTKTRARARVIYSIVSEEDSSFASARFIEIIERLLGEAHLIGRHGWLAGERERTGCVYRTS